MLWVILLCALIAVGTALAFTKCSRVYHANGGAYVYVRGVFGRFWDWLIGFIQYITLPSTIIVTIISMFRVNLDQLSIFNWAPERWSSLIIDSIVLAFLFMELLPALCILEWKAFVDLLIFLVLLNEVLLYF